MKRLAVALLWAIVSAAQAPPVPGLSGLWDATVKFDDYTLPFPIEFSQNGSNVAASFFNGDDRVTSTSGTLSGNSVTINFDHYATQLKATLEGGELKGTYGGKRNGIHEFEAKPHRKLTRDNIAAPDISGVWYMANESNKGEHAWRLIIKQKGADMSASVLRIDGDTGALVGGYQDGKFVLNHFDGARPSFLEIVPKADGTLGLTFKAGTNPVLHLTAVPLSDSIDDDLPPPTDPEEHTRVKNPNEAFRFRFPDVDGKMVSNSDARFKDKVVLVNVMGSWCPNCHDEAPFLEELYRKYHARGLEVVALDFEEPDQLKSLSRVRAFIKKYGIEYTVLVAGEPEEVQAKIPQAVNLNSWPTTFFLGRDGRVRAVRAGFAATATGSFNTSLKKSVTERVEHLLAVSARASR